MSSEFPSFKPHPLVVGGQLQTIFGQLRKPESPVATIKEYLDFEDGDRTSILIDEPKDLARANVLLFHGLGGSASSSYCIRLANKFVKSGYRVIRFNHRGSGAGELGFAKGIYHCGAKSDLLSAVDWVVNKYPNDPLSLVGFSLSGTILLNTLSDCPEEIENYGVIEKALAVCCPMDLEKSSLSLARPSNRHIDRYYTRNLLAMAAERRKLHPNAEHPILPPRMSLRLFDEHYTAPLGGFDDRNHYYQSCSPSNKLDSIRIKTQILQAANDPVIPRSSIPSQIANPLVDLRLERCGGHMGFIGAQQTRWNDKRWLDEYIWHWLRS